ncbi:hypothetical protein [Nonomuraea sp. B5E05]|uniref:SbtR family transcriptional regulator n=1 Tax=Nonomuraea sp. B5E05 TaxID=3153569 RepID=UPI00326172D8
MVRAGAVSPGVTVADLLALVTGIVLATERRPDPPAEADRLLDLAVRVSCSTTTNAKRCAISSAGCGSTTPTSRSPSGARWPGRGLP